ncbi:MAG TPA: amidase, partial [Gammaproteobacteria bacterium]|nr:amidase [Gammaproteobacteria bacterium]
MFDFKAQSINTLVKKLAKDPILLVDLASHTISQIKRYNPKFRPFVFYDENTLNQLIPDLKKLKNPSDLFGIPFGVKDIFNTEDYPTQMGSDLWKDFTPGNDARIVHYLKQQGAIIAGKTETAEFAVHALGQTLNPHDVFRTPGTSSSGSAVAVALGMVPAALGSQTAGSIIRPASFCGVYGCKPSFGLMSRTGVLKTTDTLDQVGFFTYFAEDMKTIFDAIRVKGKNYYYTHQHLNDSKRKQKKTNEPWRVAFVKTPTWPIAEDYARKNIANLLDNMKSCTDFDVNEIELPNIIYDAYKHHEEIYHKSLA